MAGPRNDNQQRPSPRPPVTGKAGGGTARCRTPEYEGCIANDDSGGFRYATPAVHGKWMRSEVEALSDALRAGVAYMQNGRITLFDFTVIETLPASACRPAGHPIATGIVG